MTEIVVPEILVVAAMMVFDNEEKVTKRELCIAGGVRPTANNGARVVKLLKARGLIVDAGQKKDPRNGVYRDAYRRAK